MRGIERADDGVRLRDDLPEPRPTKGEVVLQVRRAAVTNDDVEVARGVFGFGGVVGQHFVGEVASCGPEVDAKLEGSRVVTGAVIACGVCDLCRGGIGAHCRQRRIAGALCADGGLAERVCVPAHAIVPVPDALDDDQASMARLVARALHAARRVRVEGKPYISVLGDGPLGLLTAQFLAPLNASVRVLGRFSEKLNLCERWGVRHRHIDDVGRRGDQDIVVDCTGTPEGVPLALGLVRPLGKIITMSVVSPEALAGRHIPFDPTKLTTDEVELIGCFGGSVSTAMRAMLRRDVDVVSLISRRMRLSEGVDVLRVASRPASLVVLVDTSPNAG